MPRALDETWQLLDDCAEATRMLQARSEGVDQVLTLVCELALKVVGGDHASITTVRGGVFTTAAATTDMPAKADKIQYATNQGPCLDAIRDSDTIRAGDLATDPRWPAFGPAVVQELGVHSLLAHVLPVDEDAVGALNVYASRPEAFTAEQETLIALFGATATATLRAERRQDHIENLECALRTSRRIGMALGIIMATRQVTKERAWDLLVQESQHRNVKVAELADRMVETGSFDRVPGD